METVSKTFAGRGAQGAVRALDAVDLIVPQGAIVGVIGPSGAGKSTLIRLANGLERPESGVVRLFGRDVTPLDEGGWRRERRAIGMIFQHFNLLSSRTAFGNAALPLEIAGVPRAEIRRRVERLLDLVGIAEKRDRYPAELSGGQKQRVGIARALANEPRILLCDEATSALDPETTLSVLRLLRRVNAELGITVLLITHEIPVIKEICDRVEVLEKGRIVEGGPVYDVFTRPKTAIAGRFVAAATGVSLPAELEGRLVPANAPGARVALQLAVAGPSAAVFARLANLGPRIDIVAGRIDEIGGRPFGVVVVVADPALIADGGLARVLAGYGVRIEELGHVA